MKHEAIVFSNECKIRIGAIDVGDPEPEEVQIRTSFSSVSIGTERWTLQNRFTWTPTPFPCVPGYQRVGTITKLGANVDQFKLGELVMATLGTWNDSSIRPFWGAHCAQANTAVDQVFKIPAGVNAIEASYAVTAQVGYNAASRLSLQNGDYVLVYGDGLVGQFASQAAKARGANVIMVGHRDERLRLAAKCSADYTINSYDCDVSQQVFEVTGGQEISAVLDTVQNEKVQLEYLPLLRAGHSQIVYCGFSPAHSWANMGLLQEKELTCHYISGWNRLRMDKTLQAMDAGDIKVKQLITHIEPYNLGPEIYDLMIRNQTAYLGITINWEDI